MRVRKNPLGTVTIDFTGEEDRLAFSGMPKKGLSLSLYNGLAEELAKALRALLEAKP